MKQRWTLHIEDFAKIKEADIEVRPFTLLVGENNTGKSYVATLLWGLWALPEALFQPKPLESEAYVQCLDVVEALFEKLKEREQVVLDAEEQKPFIALFNEQLSRFKKRLVSAVFQRDIPVGKLFITNFSYDGKLAIEKAVLPHPFVSNADAIVIDKEFLSLDDSFKQREQYQSICYEVIKELVSVLLFSGYVAPKPKHNLLSDFIPLRYRVERDAPLFLPASRTGFMLSYPALVADGLDQQSVGLTLPVRLFLKSLIQRRPRKNKALTKVADWLEVELLKGKVERDEEGAIPQYQYKTAEEASVLPMYLVSSLVAEVTPVVHFLRNFNRFNALFIEEPEAHLHPSAQRVMARALAKINNLNVPLVVTTHGDTLFQQLNNLVVLHNHSRREEILNDFSYGKDETIDPKNIVAYQFKKGVGGTVVNKLESSEYGIPVPTFNEPLEALFEEISRLQEE